VKRVNPVERTIRRAIPVAAAAPTTRRAMTVAAAVRTMRRVMTVTAAVRTMQPVTSGMTILQPRQGRRLTIAVGVGAKGRVVAVVVVAAATISADDPDCLKSGPAPLLWQGCVGTTFQNQAFLLIVAEWG
jgi:hypothetical protein